MRILLIADEWNARRERDLIHRIELGLLGDADRVIYAHPAHIHPKHVGPFISPIAFQSLGTRFTTSIRANKLIADIHWAYTDISANSTIDIVHAFGHWSWPVAKVIARDQGAALCVELTSERSILRASRFARAFRSNNQRRLLTFSTGDLNLLQIANDNLRNAQVHLTPWGVYQLERQPRRESDRPSVVLTAAPWQAKDTRPILQALAQLDSDTLVFVDETVAKQDPGLWVEARSLGLLDRVDIVPLPESNRPLTLDADALLIAGRSGLLRSVVLDAFAARTPVVALEDRSLDLMSSHDLTFVPESNTKAGWRDAIHSALSMSAQSTSDTLDRAKRFADEDRTPTSHIQSVLRVYRGLLQEQAIPFSGQPSA